MAPKSQVGLVKPQHSRKQSHHQPAVDNTSEPDTVRTPKEKGKSKETDMDKERTKKDAKDIMPPPPPPTKPPAILEPELGALEDSLKNITVTTGQIFKFYADTRRLGVQKHAPRPPRSMTSTLEQELGRYDQICDTLKAHLSRAIAVLQRDLAREEDRIREEEAEKARAKAAADKDVEMAGALDATDAAKTQPVLPSGALAGTGRHPLRRPSKISLSTLHRSPFPLKLDLSSAALRLGSDEGSLNLSALDNLNALSSMGSMGVDGISGLASPGKHCFNHPDFHPAFTEYDEVTLAPKTARPMGSGELPPDVLAALASTSSQDMPMPDPSQHVDIDLTLEDDLQVPTNMSLLNAGNSADKPIELDLDLDVNMSDLQTDLFGDDEVEGTQQVGSSTDNDMDRLFGPETAGTASTSDTHDAGSGMDMTMLLSETHGNEDSLFASLSAGNDDPVKSTPGNQRAVQNEGGGDNGGFDYSMFFDGAANQEQIDMMEQILKLDNSGASAGAVESNADTAACPPEDKA